MPKAAKVKRIDGDQSDYPYVVQTPSDELIRISVGQANALANPNSPGYAATLESVVRADREASSVGHGFYFLTLPFPKSPWIAEWLYRSIGRYFDSLKATGLSTLVGIIGLFVFVFDSDLHTLRSASTHDGVALVVTMVVWSLLLSVVHELGHALALIRFGQPIRGMGICVYFGAPAFYTDSSLALLLTKRQRIIQSGAGVWVDFVLAGVVSIALAFLHPHGAVGAALVNAVVFSYFMGWINLMPIMRLDGYWMLSDALGRPQLLNEGLVAIRTNWRSRLGVYGLLSVVGTIGLVLSAVIFWNSTFHRVLTPAWHQSTWGKVVVLFFVFIAGCALVGPMISALTERQRRRVEDSEFESEHDDRVRAAEVWDELPWQPEFTEDELGLIAGSFELITPERDEPLTAAGVIPSGVFVVLGSKPYAIGFESVSGTPAAATFLFSEAAICAYLPASQARLLIGSHRIARKG